MATVGYGPLWRIDGPPPTPPTYDLLNAATVITDVDAAQIERWINGVAVYPYPVDLAHVHDACAPPTDRDKLTGEAVPLPEYGALTLYLPETCSSFSIFGEGMSNEEAQQRFVARATKAFTAVESAAIEREFMTGEVLGNNPHLGDGNGTFPWGNTATTVRNAFYLLENAIGGSGRQGMLHMTPGMASHAAADRLVSEDTRGGRLRTIADTTIVAGSGYVGAGGPDGVHPVPTNVQEWVYATGLVEVRRSELIVMPGELYQALDRTTNTVNYMVERYVVVEWDTKIQAAVLVDRCTTVCGSPS